MANNSGFTGNTNPETTNYAEHGAAGDISTGRKLKYTQDVPLALRTATTETYLYIGEASPGTLTSAALWRIKRITNSDNTILFADGNDKFDNIWDNYASLSYS